MGTPDTSHKSAHPARKRDRDSGVAGHEEDSVTDPRFIAAESDPRFSRVPKRAKKAVVDDRFKQKLKQNPGFRSSDTPVDRFGRPKRGPRLTGFLGDAIPADEESDSDSSEDVDEVTDRPTATALHDIESDDEDSDLEDFMGEPEAEEIEDIPRGKATRRLAVIGLDWSTTRAVDIYSCLDSFCPPGKSIVSVEVHPSKFGLERLAAESKFGPQVIAKEDMQVVEDAKKRHLVGKHDAVEGPGEEGEVLQEDDAGLENESGDDIGDSDDEVEEKHWKQQAALRRYEEERLKYYYAIVEFEDVKAADAVYEQCDGVDYAQSGRSFDLRFVPDDLSIETTARDRAESVPDGYMPPNVTLSSLNSSTVKLSWDADDPDRVILKKKAIGKQKLDEENLKAYLGSYSEDEEEKESATEIEKKRNMLLGPFEDEVEEEPDMGMEISFEPGMLEKAEEIVKRKQAKEQQKGETHWEARLRRLQERKAEKRRKRKEGPEATQAKGDGASGSDRDGGDDHEDNVDSSGFSDPFFSQGRSLEHEELQNKRKKRGANRKNELVDGGETKSLQDAQEEARKRAELELLVMDDTARSAKKTGSMREMLAAVESDDDDDRGKSRNGKRSRVRRRVRKDKAEKDATPRLSAMDTQDPRFQGLFDSHLFGMDPTHPKFKDNETTQRILKEKMRRSKQVSESHSHPKGNTDDITKRPSKKQGENIEKANEKSSEIRQLAARLKARAKSSEKKNRKR